MGPMLAPWTLLWGCKKRKEKHYCQLALCYADGNMDVMFTSGTGMLKGPQDINGFPWDKEESLQVHYNWNGPVTC